MRACRPMAFLHEVEAVNKVVGYQNVVWKNSSNSTVNISSPVQLHVFDSTNNAIAL